MLLRGNAVAFPGDSADHWILYDSVNQLIYLAGNPRTDSGAPGTCCVPRRSRGDHRLGSCRGGRGFAPDWTCDGIRVDALGHLRRTRPAAVRVNWLRTGEIATLDSAGSLLRQTLIEASREVPIAAARVESRPVSFCFASSQTETLWNVSIETPEPFRRKRFGAACASWLIEHYLACGKRPVWCAGSQTPPRGTWRNLWAWSTTGGSHCSNRAEVDEIARRRKMKSMHLAGSLLEPALIEEDFSLTAAARGRSAGSSPCGRRHADRSCLGIRLPIGKTGEFALERCRPMSSRVRLPRPANRSMGLMTGLRMGRWRNTASHDPNGLLRSLKSLNAAEAASVPIGALTAWQGLFEHAKLQAGERVLVQGGAGAVGIFAIQLARFRGAHVITTVSAPNIEFVRELGADEILDYRAGRFEDRVREIDVVFDAVGGDILRRSWSVLKPDGRLVTIAASSEVTQDERTKRAFFIVEPNRQQLIEIGKLLDTGVLRPVVDTVLPWSQVSGRVCGKGAQARAREAGRGRCPTGRQRYGRQRGFGSLRRQPSTLFHTHPGTPACPPPGRFPRPG